MGEAPGRLKGGAGIGQKKAVGKSWHRKSIARSPGFEPQQDHAAPCTVQVGESAIRSVVSSPEAEGRIISRHRLIPRRHGASSAAEQYRITSIPVLYVLGGHFPFFPLAYDVSLAGQLESESASSTPLSPTQHIYLFIVNPLPPTMSQMQALGHQPKRE
jgi:hypothetical protein